MAKGGNRPGAGRPKGATNRITRPLKEAILEAAERAGGHDGMVGYLTVQAAANPGPFMGLLGKVLPTQIEGGDPSKPVGITVITGVPRATGS